ncbi:MAG: DoxX family protein [Halobacteriales archaeon]|nr:DoxX family protein [Halobacteriales archaeon]
MSLVSTALLGVQGLLGIAELAAGGTKLVGMESQVEVFEHLGYPQWFRLVTGGFELLAGVALLISLVVQPLLALGGSVLAIVVLVGALGSHIRAGDAVSEMVPAAVLLVLALVVAWNQAGTPA